MERLWRSMKEKRMGSLPFVILASVIGALSWMSIFLLLEPMGSGFNSRVLATFISFLFIPIILIALTGRDLEIGGFDKGAVVSVLVYQVFAIWLIAYLWVKPEYFKDFVIMGGEHLRYLVMLAFYVPAVDFFIRRVVQREIESISDERTGFVIGTTVWVIGHGLEIIWLSELMGLIGSFTFILASGLVTSLLYMRYKNVLGLMIGHWFLNLLVSIFTSALIN